MTTAMYAAVWAALALFTAGELGKARRSVFASAGLRRAGLISLLGAVLMTAHVLLALDTRYRWDHEYAVAETARQAAGVYGFEWRGNIFVSYVFVALWYVDAWRWRPSNPNRSPALTAALRFFFFMIIVNGAVVFASPVGRVAGLIVVAALAWAWWPDPSMRNAVPSRLQRQ